MMPVFRGEYIELIPFEITTSRPLFINDFDINHEAFEEMKEWLRDNDILFFDEYTSATESENDNVRNLIFCANFTNKSDAMLFKLTFG